MAATESTSQDQSDSALMLAYAAGDCNGFELLYQRHKSPVYRFFYFGSGGDKALASELFQDVWMTVVRGRARYNVEIRFTDWLHHIAWARLYDHLRLHPALSEPTPADRTNRVTDSVFPENVVVLQSSATSDSDLDKNQEDILLGQVQNLSDDQREIVLLRYCFRMDFHDIADFLDVSRSAVTRLHREAVSSLRSSLPEAC